MGSYYLNRFMIGAPIHILARGVLAVAIGREAYDQDWRSSSASLQAPAFGADRPGVGEVVFPLPGQKDHTW